MRRHGAHKRPLRFTETTRGWVSFDHADYNRAVIAGKASGNRCRFEAQITADDLKRLLADDTAPASLKGTLHCPGLGGDLTGRDGTFRLLCPAPDARRRRIVYHLKVTDPRGRKLTVNGFKIVEDTGYNSRWRDTTRLLLHVLAGHVDEGEERQNDSRLVAAGVLFVTPSELTRTLLSLVRRSQRGWRACARYILTFHRRLEEVYRGPPVKHTQFDFPAVRWNIKPPGELEPGPWHPLPGRTDLCRRIVPFKTDDGLTLNLHQIRRDVAVAGRPVLLVGGLAMRANAFYGPASQRTLVDALVDEGRDVWVENWRTSIDLPQSDYTLDEAAAYDHPAAVGKVCELTSTDRIDAVAHCMGSASLTMSIVAGLVPELERVVSSAVSLHIRLAALSRWRLALALPVGSFIMPGVDPQWAARAPTPASAAVVRGGVLQMRRNYTDPLVAATTFIYGGKPEALWMRANMDADTLAWTAREFGYAPLSVFRQIRRSSRAGHLVHVSSLAGLQEDPLDAKPPAHTRITFLAGDQNRFFLPSGQLASFEHFDAMKRGFHQFCELKGYSHFDVLVGRGASRHVFPEILKGLR
jgi:hypothetical protein